MVPLRRMLVATDFSAPSANALGYGVALAERLALPVTVVHVLGIAVYGLLDGIAVATSDDVARLATAAQRALDHAVAPFRDGAIDLDTVLRRGEEWEEIERVAKERDATFVVIGTHARSGVARALLGSVAERIVRRSSIPVLTVRLPQEA